ncbi:MAG: SDR family NAD(P)-dependent oxidoreductase [Erythrobacter sp.]
MADRFSGTSAAITGGADGIGLALAKALVKRGARVALLDIRASAAEASALQLREAGHDAIAIECDVADASSVDAAAAEVKQAFGGLNQLWANAGVGVQGNLTKATQQDLDWVYAVNVAGMANTVRSFVPLIAAADGLRHIGFTASSITLGRVGPGPFSLYAASKWAALGMAEAITGEVQQLGIGTTIFSPGLLNTRIWDAARARPDRFGGVARQPEEVGALWRDTGMSADWAAEAAVDAVERGEPYCSPVDQHSLDDFEARVAAVRKGFVILGTDD